MPSYLLALSSSRYTLHENARIKSEENINCYMKMKENGEQMI